MGNFLSELKRRHIYRVAAAYAVLAWLLLQIVNNIAPAFDLPSWITRAVVLLLIIGFPMAVFLAWTRELAPADGAGRATTGRLDWILIGALVAVLALVSYQQLTSRTGTEQASVSAARSAAASPGGAISLAVLPFSNLSSDKEQEFFSDGMTEEITAALAKIPDLRVVARTSAFQYKGENKDMRAVGQALGATHLIEGSVRKAGNRLRITAQLIKADDGTHIWSENYDRELNDVFSIQEEIARAITASLRMPLGLKPGENLVNNRNIDTDSYEKYLRARTLLDARGGVTVAVDRQNITDATKLLEEIVAKNSSYAPGWAYLGEAYGLLGIRASTLNALRANAAAARASASDFGAKAQAALQKAVQLDPNQGHAYALLAWFMRSRGNPIAADELLNKALAADPLNANVLGVHGQIYGGVGRLKEALDFLERGHAVDSLYPNLARWTAEDRFYTGDNEGAIALAKTLRSLDRAPLLAVIYASMGRNGEAADALMELAAGDPNSNGAQVARLLRTGAGKPVSAAELPQLGPDLQLLYLFLGAPERALDEYESRADIGYIQGNPAYVWHSAFAPVRKTERFKALMRKAGLVEYWRAKGWPPQCHPTTGENFECS